MNFIKQVTKFALVGLTNTILDFSLYFCLTRAFIFWNDHYLWANAVSFITAVSWSFILNRNWTFTDDGNELGKKYFKFFSVSAVGLGTNTVILFLFVSFGTHDLASKAIATILIFFWNFSMNKLWTFKINKLTVNN